MYLITILAKRRRGPSLTAPNAEPPAKSQMLDRVWKGVYSYVFGKVEDKGKIGKTGGGVT